MELELRWHKPISLKPSHERIYTLNEDLIPEQPGIYVFLRVHGKIQEALYVGKAENLKARLRQQLDTVRLMKGIQNAETGYRRVGFAEFIPKRGQRTKKCLLMIERAIIRHSLSEGCNLLNKQGTRIANHTITSVAPPPKRKHFLPKTILFE